MSGQLGDLIITLSADVAKWQSDMGKMIKETQTRTAEMSALFGGVTSAISSATRTATGLMAVLGGGALFKDAIGTTKEVTAEIVKLKNSLGISAEDASVLRVALDDVFVSADDFAAAAARVTKQLVTNEGAFKALGVETRNLKDGSFRPTAEIMGDVNAKLMEFREGTDRNIEGVKIYGKGWEEARKTLKLTADAMAEGKKRAEELHLIVGESGLAAVKEYKLAMKDIGDVAESFKVQLGLVAIPELTKLAVVVGEFGVKAIPPFIAGLHNVQAEITRMAMLVDKAGGSITTMMYYLAGGKFTESGRWWKEQNKVYEDRYKENEKILIRLAMAEVGLDENGNPLAKPKPKGGDKRSTGGVGESDWTGAHNKYLEYLKAFEEHKAATTRIGNDLELELNRQAYAWGLTDLDTYLNTRTRLTLGTLQAEVTARQNELDAAKKAITELKPITDKKGVGNPSKDAENYHAAILKEEQAQKALAEAVGKLNLEKEKLKDSSSEEIYTITRGYKEAQAALAEYQGDIVKAAEIRKTLDEQAHARKQLEAQAATGDMEAEKALAALKILDAAKIADAEFNAHMKVAAIRAATVDVFGNANSYDQHALQVATALKNAKDDEALKTAILEQAAADRAAIQKKYDDEIVQSQFQAAEKATGILVNAAGQSKAMQLAALAVQTVIAIQQIQIAEAVAEARAFAELGYIAGWPAVISLRAMEATNIALIMGGAAVQAMQTIGKRETGGRVAAGQPVIVGEKRPELWVPDTAGTVYPSVPTGGGGVQIHQSFNITGVGADLVANMKAIAKQAGDAAKAEIMNSMNRGGKFALASGRLG